MKKRTLSVLLSALLMVSVFSACKSETPAPGENGTEPTANAVKVGMVTDSGTIDDKSFNQGTWEGIEKASNDFGLEIKYLKPGGQTQADYIKEISNLYDAGYRLIITPGFKFSDAVAEAQDKYPDCKFVIIDTEPTGKTGTNTVSIYFKEEQSGFIAGLAAALELKTGDFGFIGGMQIPSVQKFSWGYQQGIKYANDNYGTTVTMKEENFVYQGSFDNSPAGQQLAATMYDRGVKCIFIAAGTTGVGAINEVKSRRLAGEDVWGIGVDSDQYAAGLYDDTHSAIITSATKRVDVAAYQMIEQELNSTFPGGQVLRLDASSGSVGLPDENPNLSKDTTDKAAEVFEKIKSGEITVQDTADGLIESKQ